MLEELPERSDADSWTEGRRRRRTDVGGKFFVLGFRIGRVPSVRLRENGTDVDFVDVEFKVRGKRRRASVCRRTEKEFDGFGFVNNRGDAFGKIKAGVEWDTARRLIRGGGRPVYGGVLNIDFFKTGGRGARCFVREHCGSGLGGIFMVIDRRSDTVDYGFGDDVWSKRTKFFSPMEQ